MVRHARVSWNPRDDRFDPYINVEQRDPKPIPIPKRRKRKRRRGKTTEDVDHEDDPGIESREP